MPQPQPHLLVMMRHLRESWNILKKTVQDWSSDNVSLHAAAIAYYTAFSVAPLLLIAIAVAGLAFGEQAVRGEIAGQLEGLVGHSGARAIETMMASARHPQGGVTATIVGVVALLIGASGVFVQLRQSLNYVWKVESRKTQGVWRYLRSRVLSFGMVLSIGFLLLVSLVVSTVIAAVGTRLEARWPGSEVLLHLASSSVSLLLITVLFALLLKFLPDAAIGWRDVWLGAFITAFLFTIGKLGIGIYLGKSGVSSAYGAAASLGIVLIWVYYAAQLVLLGAEFTHVFAEWRRRGSVPRAPRSRGTIRSGPPLESGAPIS
jgi:membrane protein